MRKIYVVGGNKEYASWMQGQVVDNIYESNLVVFTGGEDVSPSLYGEPEHPRTMTNPKRDAREMDMFNTATRLKKHIIGICRGSQFTCVASGGRLVQHQENPLHLHPIQTSDERSVLITSTHHQAMYPYDMVDGDYKVLAWTEGLSKFHENGEQKEISDKPFKEVEVCYFPKTKVLGIQGHPEMLPRSRNAETFAYLDELLDNHMKDKL